MRASDGPTTCTLMELLEEYNFPENSLTGMSHLSKVLDSFNIVMEPDIGSEDSKFPRVLKRASPPSKITSMIKETLEQGGEKHGVELKSSVCIDTRKMQFNPKMTPHECVAEGLKAKAAQEIAAFLNRDGGIILFGITNDHQILGCEHDFSVMEDDGSEQDKADLLIRRIVERYFLEPKRALTHIQIECEKYEERYIIVLKIASIKSLVFLKASEHISCPLYMRIGNSADPIEFHELEEHYKVSRLY